MTSSRTPLRGVVPPMITPLRAGDVLDTDGLSRLVEHLISGGMAGLFILGTTGEGPMLSDRLRRELVAETCKLVRRRVPVLVCINDTAIVESIGLARHAADCGADTVVASPPCYLPLGPTELRRYYELLTAGTPLPLLLYNFPALVKTSIDIGTIRHAADNQRIVGIKDSSGNMTYFHEVLDVARARDDWTVMMGPDELLGASVLAGGHGGVNAGANLFPKLYAACCRAALDRDVEQTRALQARIHSVTRSIYTVGRHSSSLLQGIKCALSLLGICDRALTDPLQPFGPAERNQIAAALETLRSTAAV